MTDKNRLINKYRARDWKVIDDNQIIVFMKNGLVIKVRFMHNGQFQSAVFFSDKRKVKSFTQYDNDAYNTVHYWSEI